MPYVVIYRQRATVSCHTVESSNGCGLTNNRLTTCFGRPCEARSITRNQQRISPNGWLAYQSNESNQDEIYVRPFPSGDGRWPISNGGGTQPVWARNGRELFYRHGNTLLSVPVETRATFSAGTPTTVFEGSYFSPPVGLSGRTYEVSPEAQRFLMIKDAPAGDPSAAPASIDVVLNWFEELKRLLPTK